MHVGEIIFSKFQGKYEKIRINIYIYIYIYIYNFKTVVKRKFIKDNL